MRIYFREFGQELQFTQHDLVKFEERLSLDFERARRTRNLDEILETLTKTVTEMFECDRFCWMTWGF